MTTMTITDFLLARIEDDKLLAKDLEAAAGDFGDPVLVDRLVAEAAVKTRMLRYHHVLVNTGARPAGSTEPLPDTCATCKRREWPCKTLRAVVQVYTDHPDFDASWRP